jgi:glycosyltransferase involved in cell wall biosynthesis
MLITHKVDLLVLHWLSYDTPALVLQARKVGAPSVFINHFDNVRLAAPGIQRSLAHVSGIGTVSGQGIPDELRNLCVNLSDAVDTEFFTPEKARPLPRTMSPIVFLPARIEIGKGHIDLVKAASILIARKVDLLLCFAGAIDSEPLYQELCSFIATTGLVKRVLFIGEKSLEEIRDWYAMSAVVVLPSHSEGLSRVLIEAQAMKKPVVAYDIAGIREAILPGETGFLVEPGNTEALADKIQCLLDNESERLRIGELGRKFVSRQFGLSALVARHESFYLNALSTRTLSPLGTYSNLDNIQGR